MEPIPSSLQLEAPRYLQLTRARGIIFHPRRKKTAPPSKPKPAASASFISKEKEELVLEGVAIDVLVEGLGEEEQLAIALKASIDTALEEHAARVASFIYDRIPGSLPFRFFLFISLFFIGVVILMFSFLSCLHGFSPGWK